MRRRPASRKQTRTKTSLSVGGPARSVPGAISIDHPLSKNQNYAAFRLGRTTPLPPTNLRRLVGGRPDIRHEPGFPTITPRAVVLLRTGPLGARASTPVVSPQPPRFPVPYQFGLERRTRHSSRLSNGMFLPHGPWPISSFAQGLQGASLFGGGPLNPAGPILQSARFKGPENQQTPYEPGLQGRPGSKRASDPQSGRLLLHPSTRTSRPRTVVPVSQWLLRTCSKNAAQGSYHRHWSWTMVASPGARAFNVSAGRGPLLQAKFEFLSQTGLATRPQNRARRVFHATGIKGPVGAATCRSPPDVSKGYHRRRRLHHPPRWGWKQLGLALGANYHYQTNVLFDPSARTRARSQKGGTEFLDLFGQPLVEINQEVFDRTFFRQETCSGQAFSWTAIRPDRNPRSLRAGYPSRFSTKYAERRVGGPNCANPTFD